MGRMGQKFTAPMAVIWTAWNYTMIGRCRRCIGQRQRRRGARVMGPPEVVALAPKMDNNNNDNINVSESVWELDVAKRFERDTRT